MKKELLKGLTEEQIEKVKACKSPEEILKLAKEEDVELTDEQLKAISGGFSLCYPNVSDLICPNCCTNSYVDYGGGTYVCKWCNHKRQY